MGVRLPAEYQEVEYLYSDGNQYIDSGVECTSDLVVDFSFVAHTDVNAAFCGGLVSTRSNVYFRHHCSPYYGSGLDLNFYWCQHDSASKASIRYNFQINKRYYAYINPLTGVTVVNGEEKTFTPVQTGLTTGKNFGIFARISGSGAVQSRPVSIYYFKFYRNDALIGDFVPCYRKSDDKPGMYDLVSGAFFVNAGTGEFLVGPDVIDSISPLMVAWRRAMMRRKPAWLPAEYQEVEYLESSGTQYINTGIVGRDSIYVESRLMFTQTDFGNAGFLGSRQDSGDQRFYLISAWQGDWHLGLGRDFFSTTAVLPNTLYDIKVGRDWNTYMFALNVNGADILNGASSMQTTYDMYVFAVNNYGTASRFCSARLYSLKISNDNSLLMDYIPCYRKLDNKPGMYDLVSNTFFTNAGTGDFVVGADVN